MKLNKLIGINHKGLNEAKVVIPPSLLNDPKAVNLKDITNDAVQKEKQAEQDRLAAEEKAALKLKYAGVIEKIEQSDDRLQTAFDELVPETGKADTVAGEMVRAMMRIMYRDFNDGDVFYEGYGRETVLPSVAYFCDVFDVFADDFESIALRQLEDDSYTNALKKISDKVIDYIIDNPKLLEEPNTEDSRDFDIDGIPDEWEPRYDFEIGVSDDLQYYVDNGMIDSWKLNEYVEDQLRYEGVFANAEVVRPFSYTDTSVTIENLTKDGYDTLQDWTINITQFWQDLYDECVEEYGEPTDEDDDDSSDEGDSE